MRVAIGDCRAGSGKTTLTAQLGWALAASGRRVLLADAVRESTLEWQLPTSDQGTVFDREGTLIMRDCGQPTLRVLSGVGRWLESNDTGSPQEARLLELFHDNDWVLIDCPWQDTFALERVLGLVDRVLIPVQSEESALTRLPEILRVVAGATKQHPHLKLGGFVRNDASVPPPSTVEVEATTARIQREFPDLYFSTTVPFDPEVAARRTPERSAIHPAILQLAEELQRRTTAAGASTTATAPAKSSWWKRLLGRN